MLEAAAPGSNVRRAFLRIGGQSVAKQQLGLALRLGCERIVCIAHGLSPEIIALQHVVEAQGKQFHVIPGARPLLGLVTANDELIVLADGLFVSIEQAAELLEQGQCVLTQPIDQGLAAGFERIDLTNAAAGAMRLPGRLVERINDLPADCDAASSLQRIALQAGIRQRAIGSQGGSGVFWNLIRDETEAHEIEPLWVRQRLGEGEPASISRFIARGLVKRLGPAMLHAGSGSRALGVGAVAAMLLGLGAGWFGLITLGLGLLALGWIVHENSDLLERIERDLPRRFFGFRPAAIYALLFDGALVLLTGWATPLKPWQPEHDRYFAAFMLIALLRIVTSFTSPRTAVWLGDRMLLCVILIGALLVGLGDETTHIGAVVLAIAGLAIPGFKLRITRP